MIYFALRGFGAVQTVELRKINVFPFSFVKADSTARQRNLMSLRDYMQHCTNELYWLDQQAEERINYDWSDANLDYPARQRQYEVAEQTQKSRVWMYQRSLANCPSSYRTSSASVWSPRRPPSPN